ASESDAIRTEHAGGKKHSRCYAPHFIKVLGVGPFAALVEIQWHNVAPLYSRCPRPPRGPSGRRTTTPTGDARPRAHRCGRRSCRERGGIRTERVLSALRSPGRSLAVAGSPLRRGS